MFGKPNGHGSYRGTLVWPYIDFFMSTLNMALLSIIWTIAHMRHLTVRTR